MCMSAGRTRVLQMGDRRQKPRQRHGRTHAEMQVSSEADA